jgi:hypothetical protein
LECGWLRMVNSGVEKSPRVAGVRGRQINMQSRPEARKVWKEGVSVPLNY